MIITEAIIICIIILFMIIWITLFGMLRNVSKRLKSIEVDLMYIATRQIYIIHKIDCENKEK
jgi:hypothetical protein